ncbi:MAG: hypothetical protein WCO60_09060 [Verrucomicrobiota bacterium]
MPCPRFVARFFPRLQSLGLALTLGAAAFSNTLSTFAAENTPLRPASIRLDMVHNNPGEPPFETKYNDPTVLHGLGFTGKVFELFEAAQFGIDWSSVDPTLFPSGSEERVWIDKKAAELDALYTATKKAGLDLYCHTDMVILPKKLVEKLNIPNFGDLSLPETQRIIRLGVREMFTRFPQLDGLVIRIGETYLHGAPYHTGQIKNNADPEKTIIPLMQILREEVCERLNKKVIFRSWRSFDTSTEKYQAVSDGVEPHPNLCIVVKHCEDDFHRGNRFSRVLGMGRHPQLVEIQCQREYEGKGAYPNYVMHGVIDGFEEHNGESIAKTWQNPLTVGISTWSRGGGWKGPYLTNELWCDLNMYVIGKWAQNPNRTEAEVFNDFATQVLKLTPEDAVRFRRLALLSADAVYRGKRSTQNNISPQWTRDQYIDKPPLPKDPAAVPQFIQEKDDAVRMWEEIDSIATSIHIPDAETREFVRVSSRYGLLLYRIYQSGFHLAALGKQGDKTELKHWIQLYDESWTAYRKLKAEHPSCATLYLDKGFKFELAIGALEKDGIGAMVDEFRHLLE